MGVISLAKCHVICLVNPVASFRAGRRRCPDGIGKMLRDPCKGFVLVSGPPAPVSIPSSPTLPAISPKPASSKLRAIVGIPPSVVMTPYLIKTSQNATLGVGHSVHSGGN